MVQGPATTELSELPRSYQYPAGINTRTGIRVSPDRAPMIVVEECRVDPGTPHTRSYVCPTTLVPLQALGSSLGTGGLLVFRRFAARSLRFTL
jgi:hypothetical protein